MKYVVVVSLLAPEKPSQWVERYLCAIAQQSHPAHDPHRALSVSVEDAFVFTERAAAEMAAVWTGGEVRELDE